MKTHLRPLCLLFAFFTLQTAVQAGAVRVWTEYSATLNGPWTQIDPSTLPVDANGAMVLPTEGGALFFRTRIESAGELLRQELDVTTLPPQVVVRAQALLDAHRARTEDAESWPDDAVLHPVALGAFDGAEEGRQSVTFIEFQVTRAISTLPVSASLVPHDAEEVRETQLGYIIVSLTEAEAPVTQFATRGRSLSQRLAELARTPNFRLVRFGADFWVAEDTAGQLLASIGAHPWKPDPALVTQLTQPLVWEGDDETRTEITPVVPVLNHGIYASYAELKTDFRVNPVYVALRQRRAAYAQAQWQIERGILPASINLTPGQSVQVLAGVMVDRFSFDNEDEARVIDITAGGESGGLILTAIAPGTGILEAQAGGTIYRYVVSVAAAAASASSTPPPPPPPQASETFVPGWHRVYEKFVGDFSTQPHYAQMKDASWQGYIGCGPNAWGTLLAWWERERGNYLAFRSNFYFDAPARYYKGLGASKKRLKPMLLELRNIGGGVYDPGPGSFATPPGSMPKEALTVTYVPALSGWMKRSWKMRWSDFAQTLNSDGGAREVRKALKDGYCAVVGLGNYWHYAVAYGYIVEGFLATEGGDPISTRRWLRCNMCWGPSDESAECRDYYDVFFDTRLKLSLTPQAPPWQPIPDWW